MSVTRPALLCATMVTLLCSVLRAEHVRNNFPYESKTVQVHGANMHYADSEGSGHPVVFVHGIPTWSYLWRNVLPHVEDRGRLIAVDLIGFGKSEKPKINYSLVEHARYFEGFVEALELDEFTLVVHDMGSFVGLHYAMKHPEKVKGIAMME